VPLVIHCSSMNPPISTATAAVVYLVTMATCARR